MQTIESRSSAAVIWVAAIVSAVIGAAVLYDVEFGINWPIWIASAALGVVIARKQAGLNIDRPTAILLGWAVVLAGAGAITSSGLRALVVLSDAMLLGLAIITIGTDRWRSLSAKLLALVPFLAPVRVGIAALREAAGLPKTVSSTRARPVVRGLLLTLPIVIVLLVLLRNADPVFEWITQRIVDILPQWSISRRVVFFLFLLVLTVGANAVAARQQDTRTPSLPPLIRGIAVGFTEQRMVLMSVAVILWLFVLLQISYLFHPLPNIAGNGVTFADYARRGFAEMSVAVTLVGGIIIVLQATRPADTRIDSRRFLTRIDAALLIALELMLVLAFRRVLLYEEAYGFTTMRLYAQCYMFGVALGLGALWLEVRSGGISVNFARRIAVIALSIFTVLVYWNHEAWIVDRNLARERVPGKFDFDYTFRQLSWDAVPTLVQHRNEFSGADRAALDQGLACVHRPPPLRWFEWNLRVARAAAALKEIPSVSCTRSLSVRVPAPAPPDTGQSRGAPAPTPDTAPLGRTNR